MLTVFSAAMPLNVVTAGDDRRPALLLINPLGTTVDFWEPMIGRLAEHNWVIRFDVRGHGRSRGAVEEYRIGDIVGDALSVLDALEIPRSHVMGASFGAIVAAELAADHPDRVDRLVLASTGLRLGSDEWWDETIERIQSGGLEAIIDQLEAAFFSPEWQEAVPDRLAAAREMFLATPVDAYLAGAAAILHADLDPFAERIRASTLVIVGSNDSVLRHHPADDLLDRIPDSEAVHVGGARHRVFLEQPDLLADVVCRFLNDPDGR